MTTAAARTAGRGEDGGVVLFVLHAFTSTRRALFFTNEADPRGGGWSLGPGERRFERHEGREKIPNNSSKSRGFQVVPRYLPRSALSAVRGIIMRRTDPTPAAGPSSDLDHCGSGAASFSEVFGLPVVTSPSGGA